ncbi:UDP-GlcNAc:betaGal beta-1,3-N-acetylglucosaminyltransferase-like protein 1 [Condylostylus longicornis]|uniref:UDP-GlcNAc:betaGal beta-1,3-N-acetylglucosaminyltransferase-like protein 1 n=1 Tax=Condylostylus longicornis TaxID=2530218 RepID=UPI00244DBF2D|nr:UDP-GlcNAc:betaGal beta-1,3-N-acetylglucosaminyltransferase-like protein 1 [Condylostylus longicornis]
MCDIVSVIITIFNGEKWVESCFKSILSQKISLDSSEDYNHNCDCNSHEISYQKLNHKKCNTYFYTIPLIKIELCIFDDASTDNTLKLLNQWEEIFKNHNIDVKIFRNTTGKPKGVGYGRNVAIKKSIGEYLCFQDIDDIMFPNRIINQYILAKENKNSIIGSKFIRIPENSTNRFQRWANNLPESKLNLQVYTSNGPTIIMPTWFCHRYVYDAVPDGFSENGKGTPEDLIFFYKHLDNGGNVIRSNEILLIYRYHLSATTFSVSEETIWQIRLKRLINNVLCTKEWLNGFTIWNAGKQGRKLFRDIPDEFKRIVRAFCDVDQKKIDQKYNYFDKNKRQVTYSIPIIHFEKIKPPIIICMKLDLTNGIFEKNLKSLNLNEGKDYIIFS